MAYYTINKSKWGNCSLCSSKDVACVKVKKDLVCLTCHGRNKAEEQQKKANQRTAARNTGFKLRNGLAESKGTKQYEDASLQALKNDLDFVVSRYIRMLYSNERGLCQCYTCSTIKHFSLMQCGHFIPRSNMATRWLTKNLKCQCPTCNETKHGNLEVYSQRLEEEETGIVEYLKELSRETQKFGIDELKQMLYDFRAKLRIIETKFKTQ